MNMNKKKPQDKSSVFSFLKKAITACLPYGVVIMWRRLLRLPVFSDADWMKRRFDALEVELKKNLYDTQYNLAFGIPYLPQTENNGKPRFIVTLTSYSNRIAATAPNAIWSIFQQSVLPDRIILWLAHGETVPTQLRILQEHGLEIRFCEDVRSYKKLIPALKEFPEDFLITADDDLYYPRNWFAKLKMAYEADPGKIYAHRAHVITLGQDGKILPYRQWRLCAAGVETPQGLIFPTGGGGILYPPHSLHSLVTDEKEFTSLCPTADDVWFWAMAKLRGSQYNVIPYGYGHGGLLFGIQNDGGEEALWRKNAEGDNDKQIAAVLRRFPELLPTDTSQC